MSDPETTVTELLADLGGTADAVADRLRALGIKGTRHDGCSCPIANLLRSNGCGTSELEVSNYHVYPTGSLIPNDQEVPQLPPPVTQFIRRFDEGVYLDLVATAVLNA